MISVLLILGISYKIVSSVVSDTVDKANKRGVELYANSLRYAYTAYMYSHDGNTIDLDDIDINITTKVICAKKTVTQEGNIELYGCSVDGSKKTYKYVNGEAKRE